MLPDSLGDLLRRMPALARPGVAVPDRVLAGFVGSRAEAAALADPWAASPAAAPAPLAGNPRARAILASTGVPAAVAVAAAGSAAPPAAPPKPGVLVRAEAARASLGAAESALREAGADAGWQRAATALDQARAAAGRLVQALAAEAATPLRRLPAAAPPALAAAADAALARLQARAGDAAAPPALFAALAAVRAGLAGLDPPPLAVLAPLAALAPEPALLRVLPAAPAAPGLAAPRLIPLPLALLGHPLPALAPAWPGLPPASLPVGWGGRPAPPEPVADAVPPDPPDGPGVPPYGAAAAGALAGMAAAARLMRRNGCGDPLDLDALARMIAAFDSWADTMPPLDDGDYARLMQWSGLARQLALLRGQLGVVPWDPAQQPALAEALRDRARWLADRPPWPEREAAGSNLLRWLPLVDCAEAYGMPTRGGGALRALGGMLRQIAAMPLPVVRDPGRMARMMAALDAMAGLRESFGVDPTSPEAAERLTAIARALEGLPPPPEVEAAGALDRSCLDRLRRLDRIQAEALGLEAFGSQGIPLLSAGLPVLATLDAARRLGRAPSGGDAGPATPPAPAPPRLRG
jgi:hypothetical protein